MFFLCFTDSCEGSLIPMQKGSWGMHAGLHVKPALLRQPSGGSSRPQEDKEHDLLSHEFIV